MVEEAATASASPLGRRSAEDDEGERAKGRGSESSSEVVGDRGEGCSDSERGPLVEVDSDHGGDSAACAEVCGGPTAACSDDDDNDAERGAGGSARRRRRSERGGRREEKVISTLQKEGPRLERIGQSRIRVLRVLGRTLFVGPHWYCTLILLSIIIGSGHFFLTQIAPGAHFVHTLLGLVATVYSAYALLRCALADPGLMRPSATSKGGPGSPTQLWPSSGGRTCRPCDREQRGGELHCEFCYICIAGHDHHCPWMGKCIGEDNLDEFYSFLRIAFGSLGYMVFVGLTSV